MTKKEQLLYTDLRLLDALVVLDEVHSAAAEGKLEVWTTLSKRELSGWLREIAYVAQETLAELQTQSGDRPVPHLTLVKGRSTRRNCDCEPGARPPTLIGLERLCARREAECLNKAQTS